MRSHILVHGATTRICDKPFIFKNKIEKEGLPRVSPAALEAGVLLNYEHLLRSYAIQNSKCRCWCRLRGSAPFISPLNWTEVGLKQLASSAASFQQSWDRSKVQFGLSECRPPAPKSGVLSLGSPSFSILLLETNGLEKYLVVPGC